jgi:hypothetical protein
MAKRGYNLSKGDSIMPKGRKPIMKTDKAELPPEAPGALVTKSERAAWSRLRESLTRSGFTQRCDIETAIIACRRMARIERVSVEVENLPALTIEGGRLHPLVAELRNLETGLQATLGSLNLTPRSRSSSRAKAQEVQPGTDWQNETDPVKRALLRSLDGIYDDEE